MKTDPPEPPDPQHPDDAVEAFYAAVRLTRPLLRHITASVDQAARSRGVTVGQRAVLEALYEEGPLSGPRLVAVLALKRQFVFRMLGETDEAGLTARKPNPERARAHIHLLTDRGRLALSAIREAERATLREFMSGWPAQDIAAWAKVQTGLTGFFAARAAARDAETGSD